MMINIMHVITCFEPGGAEHHLVDLCQFQVQSGNRVIVVYLKGSGSLAEKVDSRIIVRNLNLKFYGDPKPIVELMKLIEMYRPDIVHAHMPPAELYAFFALKLARLKPKFIISKHNDEPFYKGIGRRFFAEITACSADHVITISNAVKSFVTQRELRKNLSNLTVIHYGINCERFITDSKRNWTNARAALRLPETVKVVGVIARLVPQKNIQLLFHALCLLKRENVLVAILGEGPLREKLESEAMAMGVASQVRFLGKRTDVENIIHAFDVLVLPSIYEGLGLVLLEAMAAQIPVIASRVSAIPEIIVDRDCGILFESGNAKQLSHAIAEVIDNRELSDHLIRNARRRVDSHFSLSTMNAKTMHVYRSALSQSI